MSSKLFTIFPMELLRWFSERDDEPRTAAEADVFGPWQVVPLPAGTHGLFRWGEGPDNHLPALTFKKREDALLAAAVLPATGRDPLYRLLSESKPHGFDIESGGEVVGSSLLFNEDVTAALHVAASILRSPLALARLLEAASGMALHHAGKILYERMKESGKG
jgi:hypothetical protein